MSILAAHFQEKYPGCVIFGDKPILITFEDPILTFRFPEGEATGISNKVLASHLEKKLGSEAVDYGKDCIKIKFNIFQSGVIALTEFDPKK